MMTTTTAPLENLEIVVRARYFSVLFGQGGGGENPQTPIYLLVFGPKNTNYSTPWACSFSMFSISFMMGASLMGKVGNTLASMSSYIYVRALKLAALAAGWMDRQVGWRRRRRCRRRRRPRPQHGLCNFFSKYAASLVWTVGLLTQNSRIKNYSWKPKIKKNQSIHTFLFLLENSYQKLKKNNNNKLWSFANWKSYIEI